MEAAMKTGELSILILDENDSELTWVDHKEFDYKGRRYDAAKVISQNGKLTIYCLEDEREKKELKGLEEHHKNELTNSDQDKKSPQKKSTKKTLQLLVEEIDHFTFDNSEPQRVNNYFLASPIKAALTSVPVPPPDFV